LNPGSEDRKEKCCHWPRAVADPGGYTGKPGRAKRPYFTGLSRSHFKVAEREGFSPRFVDLPSIGNHPATS
jgi:hypothetical protein